MKTGDAHALFASFFFMAISLIPISLFADPQVYYLPDEVVLQVQKNVSLQNESGRVITNQAALQAVLDDIAATDSEDLFPFDKGGSRLSRMYLLHLPAGSNVLEAVNKLSVVECVRYAQPNYEIGDETVVPDDASYDQQWGLATIQMPSAWNLFTGNKQTIIAEVDSGVEYTHPDLADNIWINTGEIPDNGIDDDGNGYIDDVYGWDFTEYRYTFSDGDSTNDTSDKKNEDNNPGDDGNDPYGFDSHGTHVAGIIGAEAGDKKFGKKNVVGVLWNCRIMDVQACNGNGDLADTWIVKGVRYAADNGARVINMSFGGGLEGGIVESAIRYAHAKRVVLCAAAGNDNSATPSCPAVLEHVISVAATDQNDQKTSFSDFGPTIDIAAPGKSIYSTVADDGYGLKSGTSMSCPFVSGAAGLILGYGEALGRQFTPPQVEYLLKKGADNIDAVNPDYVGALGAGRLNVYNSLLIARNLPTMISEIIIQTSDGEAENIVVKEHTARDFRAVAFYSDGTTADVTSKVTWSVCPIRYGSFSDLTPGRFTALQTPDDREVILSAGLTDENGDFSTERIITIENDPKASPLVIRGPHAVDPNSSASYKAIYQNSDGRSTDITNQVAWALTDGADVAGFDSSFPGLLRTTDSAAGRTLAVKAVWTNPADQRTWEETKTPIVVNSSVRPVRTLNIIAPSILTAGTAVQLTALMKLTAQTAPIDITSLATWSFSPAEAGRFDDAVTSPGHFIPADVAADTTMIFTVQYTTNGHDYNAAQFQTRVVPALARAVVITRDSSDDCFLNDILSWFSCSPLGLLLLSGLFIGSLLLIRTE